MSELNRGSTRIQQGVTSLKPAEQRVARYILDHQVEVLNMSIARLAEESKVSEATIIRMCRALHFKGYQDLKLRISASLNSGKNETMEYQDISANGSTQEIIDAVSSNNLQSIQDTLSVLDKDEVEKAIAVLDKARKIDVYGAGASAIIAHDFEQKFQRINRWCQAFSDNHSQLTSASHLTGQDVVLVISYSGETKEIIESIQVAKQNKATIISLTKYGHSTVTSLADIHLYASSLEQSMRSGAMASRIAQLNVIDIIFTGVASKRYDETVYYLEKTRNAVIHRQ
jgi:DNA-binding MurR/RpiR family transcriptional regulator